MNIGLFTPLRSPVASPEFLKEFGQKAEAIGIHSFWLGEHVVLFDDYESRYPGSSDGVFRFPQGSGLMDMVSSIGFLAACTSKLRLGTGICILPQNNPVYAAKEYATLDFLSNGRLDFGVGVGWSWEEFEACGAPWSNRGKRCDEYLEVINTLWNDELSSFSGEMYDLPECRMHPKPVQEGGIPICVGGHSDAALRRTARFGHGWYGINLSPDESREMILRLATFLEAEGRSIEELDIHVGAVNDQMDASMVEAYAEAGVTQLLIPFLRQGTKHLDANLEAIQPFIEVADSIT